MPNPPSPNHPRVALVLLGIGELSGGGGAERFAATLFSLYRTWNKRRFDVSLVTDSVSLQRLEAVGALNSSEGIEVVDAAGDGASTVKLAMRLSTCLRQQQYSLVHVCLLSRSVALGLWMYQHLEPSRTRSALVVHLVDASLASILSGQRQPGGREQRKSLCLHRLTFRMLALDGIYTWYEALAEVLGGRQWPIRPCIRSTRRCFVDTSRFVPSTEKYPLMVYAARLVALKDPLFFVEALAIIQSEQPELFRRWSIKMLGSGPLNTQVDAAIDAAGLSGVIETGFEPDLRDVLSRSSVFVSTQQEENFSSVVMLEAMSAGNAIVARPVGQTALLVHEGQNGLLARPDSPAGFARALRQIMDDPKRCERMGAESRRLTEQEQNFQNCASDMEQFWADVAGVRET